MSYVPCKNLLHHDVLPIFGAASTQRRLRTAAWRRWAILDVCGRHGRRGVRVMAFLIDGRVLLSSLLFVFCGEQVCVESLPNRGGRRVPPSSCATRDYHVAIPRGYTTWPPRDYHVATTWQAVMWTTGVLPQVDGILDAYFHTHRQVTAT